MTTMPAPVSPAPSGADFELYFFSELLDRAVSVTRAELRIGKLTDLVFRLAEPYPECVGIFIRHNFGTPSEFVPWERVQRVEANAVIVLPPEGGERYPEFVDQPGWLLLNEHMMGRTILDMDGRRVEVVNDVQLLQSHHRMIVAHVDVSFNGFLRKWGIGFLSLRPDRFISWKYVQPLSIEDATSSDKVSLSLARAEMNELPSEDLADALEELSGREQEAIFSVLDAEKAAATLLEAEPRAQRQIVEDLPPDRARSILSEMTNVQIADLLEALPWDDRIDLLALLPKEQAERVRHILGTSEATAGSLLSQNFIAMPGETTAGDALVTLRDRAPDKEAVTYVFVVTATDGVLLGVVDLRELVLAAAGTRLDELMASPPVTVDSELIKEDIVDLFAKYHFRLLPVVDASDRLLGVIGYKDIMR